MIDITEPYYDNSGKHCKGVFFRYTCSSYLSTHNSIEFRSSFRLLKKKSCSGCIQCQQLWEDFSVTGNIEDTIRVPKKLKPNGIYQASFVSAGVDWETGICEDWCWELIEVTEKD